MKTGSGGIRPSAADCPAVCHGDYILMLDTDERVTPELKQSIEQVLTAPQKNTVYRFARRNLFLGRFMKHSGWYPDHVLRLYPREQYQYNSNAVHESLETQGANVITLKGMPCT